VLGWAVRAGYLDVDPPLWRSLAKFLLCGAVLALALWMVAAFAPAHLVALNRWRDAALLAELIAVGAVIYAGSILLLFGPTWLRSLVWS